MKILVTGASGLLGSNIVSQALRRNHSVVALANQFAMPARENVEVVHADLKDPVPLERLMLDHWPDVVVNAAAISQPDIVKEQPELAQAINVNLPHRIAQLAHHIGALFVHISSDMVFCGKRAVPYHTTDLPEPTTPYGKQKLQAEREVLEHCPDRPIVLRIPILNGNGLQQNRSVHEKLLAAIAAGQRPKLFTNEIRQPTSATNVAELIIDLAERNNLTGIFHWAGADVHTRAEMGQAILEHFNLSPDLIEPVKCEDTDRPLNLQLSMRPLVGKVKTQPRQLATQIKELTMPAALYPWYESQF